MGIFCATSIDLENVFLWEEHPLKAVLYGCPHSLCISSNNLGQSIGHKFTKLSKLVFSTIVNICLLGDRLDIRHQFQAFHNIF